MSPGAHARRGCGELVEDAVGRAQDVPRAHCARLGCLDRGIMMPRKRRDVPHRSVTASHPRRAELPRGARAPLPRFLGRDSPPPPPSFRRAGRLGCSRKRRSAAGSPGVLRAWRGEVATMTPKAKQSVLPGFVDGSPEHRRHGHRPEAEAVPGVRRTRPPRGAAARREPARPWTGRQQVCAHGPSSGAPLKAGARAYDDRQA